MKNCIFLIILLFIFSSVKGQNVSKTKIESLQEQINSMTQNLDSSKKQLLEQSKIIDDISKKLEYQANQIDSQTGLLDTSFDGVSAQLSASSNLIGIFGGIIAIFTIGLGIYVGRIERNISRISQDNEILLQRGVVIKQDVEALSDKILNDSKGFFKVMRAEEANHILDRLISVPEDISNMFSDLASRELDQTHFLQLKEAYSQVKDQQGYDENYLIQFFQHFAGLSVTDDLTKEALLTKLNVCVESSFKNDIVKSTHDYFTSLLKRGLSNSINEINVFVKVISSSKYKNLEELYFSIFNSLSIRNNQFALYQQIKKSETTKLFRQNFGKLLIDYKENNPTEDEILVFSELENLNQQI